MEAIKITIDFIGMNYNFSIWMQDDAALHSMTYRETTQLDGMQRTGWGWPVYPEGLLECLQTVYDSSNLPIIIAENGATYDDVVSPDCQIHDQPRCHYLEQHISALATAIQSGVDLCRYMVWSVIDNFKWAEGFHRRFGLVYNDFATQLRTIKDSAAFYREVIAANGVPAPVGR